MKRTYNILVLLACFAACKKSSDSGGVVTPPTITALNAVSFKVNGNAVSLAGSQVNISPVVKIGFTAPLNRSTVSSAITFQSSNGTAVALNTSYENNDSTLVLQPAVPLAYLAKYNLTVSVSLRSVAGSALQTAVIAGFTTPIDSSRKFAAITDNALLDLVQQQTFKYFYDYGHPVSGLARERSGAANSETITSGGSGFGVMALITGISRNFITRAQGLTRMQTIVAFLKNTAQTFHGAYPHWMNGTSGVVIPFSNNDNGADLVETAYLMEGLLCARQYFTGADAAETALRSDINAIWNKVEWDWFRQNNQNVLYWHWSPDKLWAINMKIQGWNETLMTYVLAASSTTHNIPKIVYTNGWANNGGAGFLNGNTYYGYTLPLGPDKGGPLFFEHYSFLGINPNGLSDTYANYATQTRNHTLINYNYCRANTNGYGYSDSTWGLTASDIPNGYTASSPTNDVGVIAPTAAISSLPYTPAESMAALKFYYYVLGDKLFKQYGFVDAFSLKDQWFADSFLAIDQGPIIVMIENYRSQLLWNLFTSCPEVRTGMLSLGFAAPYL